MNSPIRRWRDRSLWALFLACMVVTGFAISACATTEDRYLTAEEDAKMRKTCEPVGGCALVPNPLWEQIEIFIRTMAGGQRL